MKIVHLYYDLLIAGIESMLVNIVNEQAKSGHEVTLAILHNEIDSSLLSKLDKRVNYVNFGIGVSRKNPLFMLRLNFFLATTHFDILHLHNPRLIRMIKVPVSAKKICSTQHCLCNGRLDSDYNYKIQNRFAISDAVHDDIMKHYQLDSIPVPNGILIDEFKKRKSVYQKGNALKVVQVGRLLLSTKGQDLLVQALVILAQKGIKTITVDFIGADQDGGLEKLRKMVAEHNLADNVHFLGLKEQKYLTQHLCDYDLFVLASRKEGFGLCIAEAQAAKVPTLVSEVTGPMEVIDQGRCGYHFKVGDAESLAARLLYIIENGVNSEMVEAAYKRACRYYDVSLTANSYIELYKKMKLNISIYDATKTSYSLLDSIYGGVRTRKMLKEWIKEDYLSYEMKHPIAARFTYGENWEMFSYMKTLRYLEFYTNKGHSLLDLLCRGWFWFKHRRNCKQTGIFIAPNTVGPGFHIQHRGFRHILPGTQIGSNCEILPMVLIGKKNKGLRNCRISIGNNCYISTGVTILGPVNIGNNVTIAAGAVIVRDIPDNCIVGGIPARIIKYKSNESNMHN